MHSLRLRNVLASATLLVLGIGGVMLSPLYSVPSRELAPDQAVILGKENCGSALGRYTLGPAMSLEAVEAKSLGELKQFPEVPQVPFGYGNKEWRVLRANYQSGDALHEAWTQNTGGSFLLIRQGCIVGSVTGWVR